MPDDPSRSRPRGRRADAVVSTPKAEAARALLDDALAVVVTGWLDPRACAEAAAAVRAARAEWMADFGGEQFSLGRAFYTHLEEGRTKEYFADAAASDTRVERWIPGLQGRLRDLVADVTGGRARARRGWCGPGVHVFPAGGHVAKHGGVVHFDSEGLPAHHLAARRPALSAIVMLAPPTRGGGLAVWDVTYDGRDEATDEELARARQVAEYQAGDVVLIDSYHLHQIQPFDGPRDRISATVHAAEVAPGLWETWF